MAGEAQSRGNGKSSIKYRHNPRGGALVELVDVRPENARHTSGDKSNQHATKAEAGSDIINTTDLISGISQIWDFATSSIPVLRNKTTSKQRNENLQEGNTFYYPAEEGKIVASTSREDQSFSVNLKTNSPVSPMVKVQPQTDSLHTPNKLSPLICCSANCGLWSHMHIGSDKLIPPYTGKVLSSVFSHELRNIYGWMIETRLARPSNQVNCTEPENEKIDYSYDAGETKETTSVESSDLGDPTKRGSNSSRSCVCRSGLIETLESSSRENAKYMMKTTVTVISPAADYLLNPRQDADADGSGSIVPTSTLESESSINYLASAADSYTENQDGKEDDLHEKEDQQGLLVSKDKEICSSTHSKPQNALAKQEHAFAGAFAGIFVSLCLHPVDTVKTVIQSCNTDQRSISHIGKSIFYERGVSGLYRGIASNIASSAPISAVYTFTYESVKGALLPLIAKEYHSLAHCVAGGCASVATSFIFTPSERIKQQMQVGSHYHNCWNALFSIVTKGGLSSLYTGWGAVLCRNVPHSVIKFYMYEHLKHAMLSSPQSNAQPTTIVTLVCGGLAGSTAALFSTPFDVVKTRLQTQIPGSVHRYHGVFNTLEEIAKREGLKGLYRGLTPRLAMYMTQGALFFASYESFKSLFSLEAPRLTGNESEREGASSRAL